MTDTQILQWLEGMHTLHLAVEALYVVDGYQVRVVYDGDELSPAYWGETLAAAYCKCAEEWAGGRIRSAKEKQ
jgi:hypothetical protein